MPYLGAMSNSSTYLEPVEPQDFDLEYDYELTPSITKEAS